MPSLFVVLLFNVPKFSTIFNGGQLTRGEIFREAVDQSFGFVLHRFRVEPNRFWNVNHSGLGGWGRRLLFDRLATLPITGVGGRRRIDREPGEEIT